MLKKTVKSIYAFISKGTVIVIALALVAALTACGSESADVDDKKQEKKVKDISIGSDSDDKDGSWDLDYVDAHGERHTAVIDPDLKMHDYDWNNLVKGDDGTLSYSDDKYQTRKGIDVSSHQGDIDWAKVKAAGIDFVFVRIVYRAYGEKGQLFADERARDNIKAAQAAGLDAGVYVFSQAVNEKEAVEEAELTLKQLEGLELELPVVFDPETILDDEARTDDVSGEQFTDNTIAFLDRISEAGYKPMVYSNMVWEDELFDMKRLQDYPFWYADYEIPAQTPYAFSVWQYSEKGQVDGVEGAVDLNLEFIAQ